MKTEFQVSKREVLFYIFFFIFKNFKEKKNMIVS